MRGWRGTGKGDQTELTQRHLAVSAALARLWAARPSLSRPTYYLVLMAHLVWADIRR